ncbi:MAG TPA: hypothetical protein VHI50_03160 [Micromonosporaceae bacterium]|nr:hypothetical protein [Micromonosporaceae bacterium]
MRQTVTIQAAAIQPRSAPRKIELHCGESATFGSCDCAECGIDLPLPTPHAEWFAGEVTAAEEHWVLTNLSDSVFLIVENLENRYEYVTIDPTRCDAPVPFELARVSAGDTAGAPDVTVFGPEPRRTGARARHCDATGKARPLLNRRATYFAVLQVLCGPRLAGVIDAPLPTSAEIAELLAGRGTRLTARAVDAHIEYVTGKLGLRRGAGRDIVVASAIRRGLLA